MYGPLWAAAIALPPEHISTCEQVSNSFFALRSECRIDRTVSLWFMLLVPWAKSVFHYFCTCFFALELFRLSFCKIHKSQPFERTVTIIKSISICQWNLSYVLNCRIFKLQKRNNVLLPRKVVKKVSYKGSDYPTLTESGFWGLAKVHQKSNMHVRHSTQQILVVLILDFSIPVLRWKRIFFKDSNNTKNAERHDIFEKIDFWFNFC